MRKPLLILIILSLFTIPTSAFSDNFNDNTFNAWTSPIDSGMRISFPSWDGSNYTYSVTQSHGLNKTITTKQNYWEIKFKNDPGLNSDAFFYFRYMDSNDYCAFHTDNSDINIVGSGFCSSLSQVITLPNDGHWWQVDITDLGTTIKFDVRNATNQTIMYTATISDTANDEVNSSIHNIRVQSGTAQWASVFFDDITVLATTPGANDSVSWGADTHYSGDLGTITYVVSDDYWSCATCPLYQIRANIYKGDTLMESSVLSTQAGTIYYPFSELESDTGGYTVKLISYFDGYYLLGFAGTEIITANTSLRSVGASRIIVNSSVIVGTPQTIQFYYGFTVSSSCALCGIKLSRLNPDGYYQESFNSIISVSGCCGAGVVYSIPITFKNPGTYKLELWDILKGTVDTRTTNAIVVNNPPTVNLTTSFINITKTAYVLGDEITGSYGINNANFTNASLTFYLRVHSYDFGVNSDKLITNQISSFSKKLASIDKECASEIAIGTYSACREYTETFAAMQGDNRLQVIGKTSAGTEIEITGINFTVDVKDTDGYGISPNKYTECTGNAIKFTVYSPLPSNFTIYDSGLVLKLARKINATTGTTISYTFTKADTYTITLDKSDGTTRFLQVKIISCAAPTPTATQGTGIESGQEAAELLASKIFWALIMTVGIMMYIGRDEKRGYLPMGIAGMTSLGVFTYMTWVPAWIFFSIIVVAAYLMARDQTVKEG